MQRVLGLVNCIVDHVPGLVLSITSSALSLAWSIFPFGLTETPSAVPSESTSSSPVRISRDHYLGEPVETWFGDGDTIPALRAAFN
jgi:hypothetical protein